MKTEEEVTHDFWQRVVKSFANSGRVAAYSREARDAEVSNFGKLSASLESKLAEIFSPENVSAEMRDNYEYYNISCTWDSNRDKIIVLEKHRSYFSLEYKWRGNTYGGYFSASYSLYDMPLMNVVEIFRDFKNKYESNCEKLEKLILENKKKNKLREMSDKSLEALLKSLLATKEYKCEIEKLETVTKVRIQIKKRKVLEIRIRQKNFAEQIKLLPKALEEIEDVMNEMKFDLSITSASL